MKARANLSFFVLMLASQSALGQSSAPAKGHDFDFWIGAWTVNLRVMQPDNSWKDQIQAREFSYSILDGKAILELWNETSRPDGRKGYSLRYYRPDIDRWELWLNWPSRNSSGSGALRGVFRHKRGEFFQSWQQHDTTITARYSFSDITPDSFRWDDAYTADGGKTWTNRWIMEFTRESALAPKLSVDAPANSYGSGALCDSAQFRVFEQLSGEMRGTMRSRDGVSAEWKVSPANMTTHKIIGGCATISFLEYPLNGTTYKRFSQNSYNTTLHQFEVGELDNVPGTVYQTLLGSRSGNAVALQSVDSDTNAPTERRSTWTFDANALKLEEFQRVGSEWVLMRQGSLTRVKRT